MVRKKKGMVGGQRRARYTWWVLSAPGTDLKQALKTESCCRSVIGDWSHSSHGAQPRTGSGCPCRALPGVAGVRRGPHGRSVAGTRWVWREAGLVDASEEALLKRLTKIAPLVLCRNRALASQ